DCISLYEILIRVANVVNNAEIGLEYRFVVSERSIEFEPVSESGAAGFEVITGCDVQFIAHVVVEVVFVGADGGILMGVNAERDRQGFMAGRILTDEGVNVGVVGRWIERDQRRVHMAGSERRN